MSKVAMFQTDRPFSRHRLPLCSNWDHQATSRIMNCIKEVQKANLDALQRGGMTLTFLVSDRSTSICWKKQARTMVFDKFLFGDFGLTPKQIIPTEGLLTGQHCLIHAHSVCRFAAGRTDQEDEVVALGTFFRIFGGEKHVCFMLFPSYLFLPFDLWISYIVFSRWLCFVFVFWYPKYMWISHMVKSVLNPKSNTSRSEDDASSSFVAF